jgi:hypothetical protein
MRLPWMTPSDLKSDIESPVSETADPRSTGDACSMSRKGEHESMRPPQRWWPIPRQLSRVIW